MKTWIKGFVAGGALALAFPAFANTTTSSSSKASKTTQQQTMKSDTMKSDTMKSDQMNKQAYTIKEVDAEKKMVTLEVPLAPNASIMKDGQKVSLAEIKEGDDVRASFDPKTKKIVKLDVQSSKDMDMNKDMNKDTDMNKGMDNTQPDSDMNK